MSRRALPPPPSPPPAPIGPPPRAVVETHVPDLSSVVIMGLATLVLLAALFSCVQL
jgi:hypothetical protein